MSLALRPLGGATAIRAPRSCRQARLTPRFAGQARSVVKPGEDLPPWVRREKERELAAAGKKGLPWPLYLVFSCLVAIASVGSFFEYFDHNAIFGVIQPDSPLWAPVLGLFGITGLPTAGFLFFKGVQAANEAAETQDRIDGYIK
ncbi:hypothetical protein Rsub_01060 [Raphidocelis subcapitata]|uniref:Uncharacterized protein n=1 Tax=Raphidocelis subcapitata TaxID=307507 RepID=A0A2V0NLN7_9CHLO|nr:hypothetical protein Rsub_01060 [Raphidocelis subcapitata]|eukprot:GBF88348.1 hypothetical protein Rsub_01060 [Raphidocelis subcapitata]